MIIDGIKTISDATANGFVVASRAKSYTPEGCIFSPGGGRSYGYDYAILRPIKNSVHFKPLVKSVSIWLSDEPNKIGGKGCSCAFFKLQDLEAIEYELCDSETNESLSAGDLGITDAEYAEAIQDSLGCDQPEGHVYVGERKVYAAK